uniref:Uncharacterized protein n=1 Tax=Ditylenchus dipsaci TaxID=166011 RepID=A0A915CWZ1_9BILA
MRAFLVVLAVAILLVVVESKKKHPHHKPGHSSPAVTIIKAGGDKCTVKECITARDALTKKVDEDDGAEKICNQYKTVMDCFHKHTCSLGYAMDEESATDIVETVSDDDGSGDGDEDNGGGQLTAFNLALGACTGFALLLVNKLN